MSVFADSSAVVKLHADESGHEEIRSLDAMYVSQLARVEVPAAVWRKSRMDTLPVEDARLLVRAFERDLFASDGRLIPVVVSGEILDDAASLAATHGLRAYDAVQLATARTIQGIDPYCRDVAAFDTEFREAAAREGFRLIPDHMPQSS